jgi:hypothetical protein
MDKIFNNPDFYPTPEGVIFQMLEGVEIENKTILEPSAGKGNIIDYLTLYGAKEVLFCELNEDLAHISGQKARFLQSDFLTVDSSQISHIDLIVMNPPFSADEKHILHAFSIAPAGCKIISLCNAQTIKNTYSQARKELKNSIDLYGSFTNLGNCFENSERETGVEIGFVILQKPGASYSTEFEGFFLDDEEEPDGDGIMSYNIVRDLVNRYVGSIKIFDKQLEEAEKMNQLTSGYFSVKMGMSITNGQKPIERSTFKKEMQKSGWNFIFNKMNMQKYATKGMRDDINKFVEEKTEIPFTMKNIYVMLATIVQTQEQTMDKAILEVFDKVTEHYHDNRFNVEGWKTNSHYLLNQRFIFPSMVDDGKWSWTKDYAHPRSCANFERIEDLVKAICFITGDNYDEKETLNRFMRDNKMPYGVWVDWDYFRVKGHKKGTIHFEFKDRELWGRFNQRVAKLKGYPLFEKAPDKRTERQKAKEAAQPKERPTHQMKVKPVILGTYKMAL